MKIMNFKNCEFFIKSKLIDLMKIEYDKYQTKQKLVHNFKNPEVSL